MPLAKTVAICTERGVVIANPTKYVRSLPCHRLPKHVAPVPPRLLLPLSRTLVVLPIILPQRTSKLDVKLLNLLDLLDMMPQNSWSSTTVSDIAVVILLNPTRPRFDSNGLLYH